MDLQFRAVRLGDGPIIHPRLDPSIGENIQGPSLIKVPDWIANPLGRYYLYFADHKGAYIRLAYANQLQGPWKIHKPGSLQLNESHFPTKAPQVPVRQAALIRERLIAFYGGEDRLPHDVMQDLAAPHIASPDVHLDHENRRVIMYFHGLETFGSQLSRVALSRDGIHFEARPEILGRTYMRAFNHENMTYVLAMPGTIYRSSDGLTGFEEGPAVFNDNMRHSALLKRGNRLYVFWTQVGDAPERILVSLLDLSGDWMSWKETAGVEVLRPEYPFEGADAPLVPSMRSVAYGHVNQLRDPAIYQEGDKVYLLYAVAGESGIALAELIISQATE